MSPRGSTNNEVGSLLQLGNLKCVEEFDLRAQMENWLLDKRPMKVVEESDQTDKKKLVLIPRGQTSEL